MENRIFKKELMIVITNVFRVCEKKMEEIMWKGTELVSLVVVINWNTD